jgi:hypothetical protein
MDSKREQDACSDEGWSTVNLTKDRRQRTVDEVPGAMRSTRGEAPGTMKNGRQLNDTGRREQPSAMDACGWTTDATGDFDD